MNIIRLFHRFIPPYRGYVVLNILFNLFSTVLSLFSFAAIIPILQILFGLSDAEVTSVALNSAMSIDELIAGVRTNLLAYLVSLIHVHSAVYVLFLVGVFLVVTTFFKCLTAWLANYFMVPIRTGVLRDLRMQLYGKVITLPIGYFTEERKGDVMSRMTNDVNEVETGIMSSLDVLFKDPLMIVVYLSTLFLLSWQLTLFVLILLPVAGILIGRIGRSLKRSSTRGQEQTADILNQIEETISGLRVVKAFNAEHKLSQRFSTLINETRRTFNLINRRYYLAHPVSEFLGTTLIAVLLWYGGSLILSANATFDAPTFIYYLVVFYSIINPAKNISKAVYGVRRGQASLERIDKILLAENPIKESERPTSASFEHEIEFRDVTFSYDGVVPVLEHINLTIEKGKMVALVGQSGSGKTTLTDLLPRFYDVQSGSILIDGVDIRNMRVHDLRALMGIVNQDAILFNDTVRANITFGVDDGLLTEPGKVEKAATIANASDFISAMPEGYDTNIGDRGSRLSGGQRQRLSIARAVLKNPPILILDEATSALDTESEKLVQQALENLMRERTTLVVAHRLSTIRKADLICVLHEGRIVERGSHEQLLAMNGYYKKLYDLQLSD